MSDQLPIVEVPESTWLRALAHALDPDVETADESLAPDDVPVEGAADEQVDAEDSDADDDDDDDDGAADGTDLADDGPNVWDTEDDWAPSDDGSAHDTHDHPHDDDGIG